MDDEQLKLVVENIFIICTVKVKTPTMSDDLKKYITDLEKDILEGKL